MTIFRRIVMGLDLIPDGELSDGARLAIEQTRWLARSGGVRVTILHSTRREEQWDARQQTFVDAGGAQSAEQRGRVEAAADVLRGDGIETQLVFTEETAWIALVREVLREPADLVITGKRATSQHDGRPVGSVAQKLLRNCPCPVWVVKPGSVSPPRLLLAASDLSRVGEIVLDVAARLASEAAAELHVVHALQLPFAVQMEGEDGVERWLVGARAEATTALQARLEAAGRRKDEIHVGLTSPTRAVVECVERLAPDLVVMGTVSRGGIAGMLVGNTAERLLGRLDCSILAVKPADFVCPVSLPTGE